MKYGLVGASGKLGKEVITAFTDNNHELVFSIDIQGEWKQSDPEVLIDCSLPEAFDKLMSVAKAYSTPLIVATTGWPARATRGTGATVATDPDAAPTHPGNISTTTSNPIRHRFIVHLPI